jgi:membrane-bound lytic murein transglycosylase D
MKLAPIAIALMAGLYAMAEEPAAPAEEPPGSGAEPTQPSDTLEEEPKGEMKVGGKKEPVSVPYAPAAGQKSAAICQDGNLEPLEEGRITCENHGGVSAWVEGTIPSSLLIKDGKQEKEDNGKAEDTAEPEPTTAELVQSLDIGGFDLPMVFNERVIYWVEWFSGQGRWTFLKWMKRSGRYKAMIQSELRKAGLPQDLFYLAMIESGFVPSAESSAAAVGVWQIIPETAGTYHLSINAHVDERRDPYRSTIAAIAYLKKLHREFGYWYMAMAAYNAGESRVHGAMKKQGSANYWSLCDAGALPNETIDYVPRVLAAAIIDKNPALFGFSSVKRELPVERALTSAAGGHHTDFLAEAAGMEPEAFLAINPHLVGDRLPDEPAGTVVYVPPTALNAFNRILHKNAGNKASSGRTLTEEERADRRSGEAPSLEHHRRIHLVAEGESLERIAAKEGLDARELGKWNGLSAGEEPQTGSTLRLTAPPKPKWVEHVLKGGESLGGLAKKYGCSEEEIRRWNGLEEGQKPGKGDRLWIRSRGE